MRLLSEKTWNVIDEFILQGLNPNDERLPNALCSTCSRTVREYSNGNFSRKIVIFDHSQIEQIVQTRRITKEGCPCLVCEVATSMPRNICQSKTLRPNSEKLKGQSSKMLASSDEFLPSVQKPAVAIKVCSFCLSILARGCPHVCTKSKRFDNLQTLVSHESPKSKEKMAVTITKDKLMNRLSEGDEEPIDTPSSATTSAKLTSIKESKRQANKNLLSAKDLSVIQNDLSLSNTQTLKLAGHIRYATACRNSVEPNLKQKLLQLHHRLDGNFTVLSDNFLIRESEKGNIMESRQMICCNDVTSLIYVIEQFRQKSYNQAKIGLDGGGGFLKVSLTLMSLESETESACITKRRLLADGVAAKSRSEGSVQRLFLLAIVPDVPENYRNLLSIWVRLRFDELHIPFTIASDLKLSNLLIGIMAHGSTHPCTWCDVSKDEMLKGNCGVLRTLGNLRQQFWQWNLKSGRRSEAKKYGNVVHLPICRASDETVVLDLFPPPELHLLIGPVTTLLDALQKKWSDTDKWLTLCHIQRQAYHGGSLNGNACLQLLQRVDLLESTLECPEKQFIETFRSFKAVVDACYGNNLSSDFQNAISKFSSDFMELPVRMTPKVHCVVHHIRQFCEKHSTSLGRWSEQSTESLHSDFEKTWERFKVSNGNPKYGSQLLKAVCNYNSNHV